MLMERLLHERLFDNVIVERALNPKRYSLHNENKSDNNNNDNNNKDLGDTAAYTKDKEKEKEKENGKGKGKEKEQEKEKEQNDDDGNNKKEPRTGVLGTSIAIMEISSGAERSKVSAQEDMGEREKSAGCIHDEEKEKEEQEKEEKKKRKVKDKAAKEKEKAKAKEKANRCTTVVTDEDYCERIAETLMSYCVETTKEWRTRGAQMSKLQDKIMCMQQLDEDQRDNEELNRSAVMYNSMRNSWNTDQSPGKPDHCTVVMWKSSYA